MKVAIYGQYYQNSTEPIIRDIFVFFNETPWFDLYYWWFSCDCHQKAVFRI